MSKFIFLFFVFLPCGATGLWHALLPNGPLGGALPIKIQTPPASPISPPLASQQQPVQLHTIQLPASQKKLKTQTTSPVTSQEAQSTTELAQNFNSANANQAKFALPQNGFPVATGFPMPSQQEALFQHATFAIPEWLLNLAKTAAGFSAGLSSLGITGMPDINVCGNAPIIKEVMICIQNALEEVKSVFLTGKEIVTLNSRVMAGGRTADKSLQRLKTLSSKPYGKVLMKVLGTTMVTQMLMQRESTPDRQRWQAGSVITLVTDLPVTTVIADAQTGSFGHVNVVLPRPSRVRLADKMIKMLDEGVSPVNLPTGPLPDLEGGDDIESLSSIT